MDFSLSDEQQMIRDMCREFAEEEIKPHAEEMDRSGEFPYEIVHKMADLGLLGDEDGAGGFTLPRACGDGGDNVGREADFRAVGGFDNHHGGGGGDALGDGVGFVLKLRAIDRIGISRGEILCGL